MRKRFTRALYAVSAAAVITAGLGLSAGAATASTQATSGTVACGFNCINIFSQQLGDGVTMNAYVPGDTGVGGRTGQLVNMRLAGNDRPNGDWEASVSGFVFQYCGFLANDFFSPNSYICHNYPFFFVIELNWAPYGNQSGWCAGVARAAVAGQNVTLQPCGVSANTVWVLDRIHSTLGTNCLNPASPPVSPGTNPTVNYCPWINGGDTRFSQPLVLTLNTGTTRPWNQLFVQPLLLQGGAVRSGQQFAFFGGPVA